MAAVNNVPKDLQDSIREFLGRRVKLYIKRMVKQEVRLDKWENRVVAFSGSRLFVFSSKTSKSLQEHNICYLDIHTIESNKPNQLVITTYEGKSYSFVTLETETDEVNHMITHIGTSIKQIFPSFPLERFIKKVDVKPPERLRMMNDMIKTIETKEHGPCGNFAMMYGCMCDYFNLPYREEVEWDIDNIYSSQECKVLTLKEFDHLASARDLQPIVSSIENNTWFTGLNLSRVKMTSETQGEFLKVMQKNCLIEEINLSSTGISVEFVTKLGTAILSNAGSQLTKVDLSKNVLDDRAMISFLGSLSNLSRGLTHLNISSTRLTGKGLNKIFEILMQHESIFNGLQVLNFSDNPTKGEDLQQMYKFLGHPNGITHLDLSGTECALENLMVALQRGCINMTHLCLSRNIFTYKKSKEIVVQPSWKQFFATMCCVEHLDLSYCKIPVEALKDLMLGICSNIHLTNLHLNIAGNDFQQQGSLNIESTIANIQNISSLDISNNNLDQGLVTLLPWIKMCKSLKHLSIGRNFSLLKPKQLKAALEGVVQLIEDQDCNLESLSMADSKLKLHVESIINAVGNNGSLTELDISGNYMTDLGARWLSKILQVNNKLKTIIWERNGTTFQGFEDIAEALEKNYTLKIMPVPLNDICGQHRHLERTEAAIQKIEALLQRNHSPRKYSSENCYRIKWSYSGSQQEQIDRQVVQVQDTINALQRTPSADDYKEDIEVALSYVEDANNSQMLLPQLQNKADESVGEDNPVAQRLKEISLDLKKGLDMLMKKTVEGMLECTTSKLTEVMKNKEFSTELQSGCVSKSSLPEDFAIHTMDIVKMDIFNKLGELNQSVVDHISDRVSDAVKNNLSSSLKTLTKHLKEEKNKDVKTVEPVVVKPVEHDDSDESSPAIPRHRKTMGKTRPRTVIDAEHVKKALEVYNSVNSSTNPSPLTQEATPTPCPGIRAKVLPTASNVNDVSMTTLRESEELKKEDEPDRKKDPVTDPIVPIVKILSNSYNVILGNTITLDCQIDATPRGTVVFWRRVINKQLTNIDLGTNNNKKYSGSTVSTPSLTITNAQNSDKGNYVCYATNLAGTGSSNQTFLDVVGISEPGECIAIPENPLPVGAKKPLVHLAVGRPRPQGRRRPTTPATATNIVEIDNNSTEDNNDINDFFKPAAVNDRVASHVNDRVASPVTSSTPENEKRDKKKLMKETKQTKTDGGIFRSLFGNKQELTTRGTQPKSNVKGLFGGFGKKSAKDHEKKEEVKPDSDTVVPKEVSSTPDKENTEPEKKEEIQQLVKEEPKVEIKHETEEVNEPKKAMRPPVGAVVGLNSEMLSQLKQRQQKRQSTGKVPTDESTKEKEVIKSPKTATSEEPVQPKTSSPVPGTTDSPSTPANNTDVTKATPDKTRKSVLSLVHDQKRPKAAPRPDNTNSRISTSSRNSGVNGDSEYKGSSNPVPKPRPNPPPKPRSSVKSDDLTDLTSDRSDSPRSSDSGKRLSTDKSSSLPRSVPPVTEQAEKTSRPTSMFAQSDKETDKTLSTSKTSGELADSHKLIKDLAKIVEVKNEAKEINQDDKKKENGSKKEEKKEEKKDEKESEKNAENSDSKGSSENGDSKRSSAENGDSKGSSAESDDSKRSSAENTISEDDKTDFESDVIMV